MLIQEYKLDGTKKQYAAINILAKAYGTLGHRETHEHVS